MSGSTQEQTNTSFSQEQIDVIVAIEQCFWSTGQTPTTEKIQQLTGVSKVSIDKYMKSDLVRESLLKRGVDLNPKKTSKLLTLQQMNLANLMLNTHDTRSVREKLTAVGVSSQQYHAWLRTPAFSEHLQERARHMFESSDPDAYMALVGAVRNGDNRAIQLFFEMRGIYNPRTTVDININVVLTRVVEVISRHVRDPEMLQAIANDLELIELGQVPSPSGPVGIPAPIIDVPSTPLTNNFVI